MYEEGFLTTSAQISTMRKCLFQKLKQSGVLPQTDKCLQSLVLLHTELYDRFSLLTQVLLPYLPAFCNGVQIGKPTWQGCNLDMFILQAHLVTFYATEEVSGREYTEMEKSRMFLALCMESKIHKETTNYYHIKLKELGSINILPP